MGLRLLPPHTDDRFCAYAKAPTLSFRSAAGGESHCCSERLCERPLPRRGHATRIGVDLCSRAAQGSTRTRHWLAVAPSQAPAHLGHMRAPSRSHRTPDNVSTTITEAVH